MLHTLILNLGNEDPSNSLKIHSTKCHLVPKYLAFEGCASYLFLLLAAV